VAERYSVHEAIVLDLTSVGEYDAYLDLFTRTGRMHARAPGLNRPTSRLKGILQPLNWVSVHVYRRGRQYTVVGAELRDALRHLKERLEGVAAAHYLAELVGRLDLSGELFDWALEALRRFDEEGVDAPHFLGAKRALLARLGWDPGGKTCPLCGRRIVGEAKVEESLGAFVHPECRPGGVRVSGRARAFLAGEEEEAPWGEVWAVLRQLFVLHLGEEPKAERFARSVLLRGVGGEPAAR